MKAKFCILLCLVSMYCFGQDSVLVSEQSQPVEKHLIVKGMPINGDYNDFIQLFLNDGYEIISGAIQNSVAMKGIFAGREARTLVQYTPITKTVYSVLIVFDDNTSFFTARSNYKEVTNTYIKKYGAPTKIRSEFKSPYYEGDGYEDSAMRLGKIDYVSCWELTEGRILICIANSGAVMISYMDKINEELNTREMQSNASYDI